jgi:DHA3 family tetracycline resistance protein-like MFS transporter
MFGQVDAIGQTMGGPVVGLIANAFSVRLAISLSSLLLSPALLFLQRANRIPAPSLEPPEPASEPAV